MTEKDCRNKLAFEVIGGKVVFANRQQTAQTLAALPDGEYYLVPKRKTHYRSAAQNSRLWRMYCEFAKWCNAKETFRDENGTIIQLTAEMVHLWCKHKFTHLLPKSNFITPDGELIETDFTTTRLVRQSTEIAKSYEAYYEAVAAFLSEYTNYELNI
jgi:hypothetical protein